LADSILRPHDPKEIEETPGTLTTTSDAYPLHQHHRALATVNRSANFSSPRVSDDEMHADFTFSDCGELQDAATRLRAVLFLFAVARGQIERIHDRDIARRSWILAP